MITRLFIYVCIVFSVNLQLHSQDKPPVAVNDSVTYNFPYENLWDTIIIYPLANDYSEDNHKIKIAGVTTNNPIILHSFNNDSTIHLVIHNIVGLDSVPYFIQDEVNGLYSNTAKIYFSGNNKRIERLACNNINTSISSNGINFGGDIFINDNSSFEAPKGSGNYSIANLFPHIAGITDNNKIISSPAWYRQNWNGYQLLYKYWPGPVSDPGNQNTSEKWDRVWKLKCEEIDYHINNFNDPDYIAIDPITNWPGNGDTTLGQSYLLAPFMDLNSNNQYEPAKGDYPLIRGHEAIYFICNDSKNAPVSEDTIPFYAEIHGMAYAYHYTANAAINNSIFIHYDIINRSSSSYHNSYIGIESKQGLGCDEDDYTGCDTILNAIFSYNKDNIDSTSSCDGYGSSPPAIGITFLNHSLKHFIFNNFVQTSPEVYYNNLNGLWYNGTPITYGGSGMNGSIPVNHLYPGDPNDTNAWSMYSANQYPGRQNVLGSAGPFDLQPSDTISFDIAITYAHDPNNNHLNNLSLQSLIFIY